MDVTGMTGLLNVTVPRILAPTGGPGLLGGARQPPLPRTPPEAAWLRDRMVDAAANLELDEVWSLLAQTNRMKRICGGQTWSPLPDVVRFGQTSYVLPIIDRLHALGCDLRAQSDSGSTAIHEATRSRNDPVLRHLLLLDDDLVNCQDFWGQTPLHVFLQTIVTPSPSELDRRVVEALLTPQFDWTLRDVRGMSASFHAVAANVPWFYWRLTEQSPVHLDLFETNSEGKTLLSSWLDVANSPNLQLKSVVAQAFMRMSDCWQLPDGPTAGRLLATRPPYVVMKTWMDMLLECPRRISESLCYEDSHGLQLRYLVPHALHKSSRFHQDWDFRGTRWKNLESQILRILQIAARDPFCRIERTLHLRHRNQHLFNLVARAAHVSSG
ncbi:MAG: uncharacterized protein KVP18_002327 [Porospora cf. gigantea A]|uniref:uncharacterized protein n=1 Tax=Porospora cf. gigantea A TaxID=2853593 RepID=UPI00355999CA|nr:MAG: hypothetical protein KVP18_002327 [Porospora cf. gigantea A]